MIYIGYPDHEKEQIITRYQTGQGITKVVIISPKEFPLIVAGADLNEYHDIIEYVTFYRLLQTIDMHTLVVVNECLRTQNRYDLTYNCIRNFLNLTSHKMIFQQLPQIDTVEDFMILFDFDTRSQWKRRPFDPILVLENSAVQIQPFRIEFESIVVSVTEKTRLKYAQEKEKLFSDLGDKDPNTIPRNLYLIGGADKATVLAPDQRYVARNKRLGTANIITYGDIGSDDSLEAMLPQALIEFPHRFIDFSDFLKTTWQTRLKIMVADLKVDHWYLQRYQEWKERLNATYASLCRR